jgi:hypothetical protein
MLEGIRILAICFVDVVIGVSLIVLGLFAVGAAQEALTPDLEFFRFIWLAIAFLPFVAYAKWRNVANFDWWDVVVYGSPILISGYLGQHIPAGWPVRIQAYAHAFLTTILLMPVARQWEKYRKSTFPRPNQTTVTLSPTEN